MTELIAVFWFVIALLTAIALSHENRRAEAAKRTLAEIERHADAWEQRAIEAETTLAEVEGRYTTLQALYCEWVRKTFGQSVAIYRVEKAE